MDRSAEHTEGLLRERSFALTPQRRAIVRRLAERGGHWTASELHEDLTREFPMASRATVYSTLGLLRELGVVNAVPIPGGELRFDTNPEPHHHFLCRGCGELIDLPAAWLRLSLQPDGELPFRVERFQVVAEGMCRGCGGGSNR